jgi:hypothetical protein
MAFSFQSNAGFDVDESCGKAERGSQQRE